MFRSDILVQLTSFSIVFPINVCCSWMADVMILVYTYSHVYSVKYTKIYANERVSGSEVRGTDDRWRYVTDRN